MFNAKPESSNYNELINNIESGRVKIPQFQRKFVWSLDMTVKLLDSIIKGYPIGSFILWKTRERLRSIRNVGGISLPEPPDGDMIQYVLDGQQRMTSLYVAMRGLKINDDDRNDDFSEIYVDLEAKEDEPIVIGNVEEKPADTLVRFTDLLGSTVKVAIAHPNYSEKIEAYSQAVKGYQFSIISVSDAPIEIATEIFTRLNEGGKRLSVFEIMVAKTYDLPSNFDLSEKYEKLVDELKKSDFETISSAVVLQAVSACLVGECAKKHILKLDKFSIIKEWDNIINAFKESVDYMHSFFRIPVSQLMPYDSLLVPFTYYFYKHKEKPIAEQQMFMQDFFWRCVLTSRYSAATETKLAQDIKRIDAVISGNKPDYDEPIDISEDFLKSHGGFSTGAAFIKGMLCLLAYHHPQSFLDNSLVTIDNSWLKQANSKNYHHFFPKAYMKKRGFEDSIVNHIANITIVDDFLNKRKIQDKAPSKYIKEFKKNKKLESALQTHLICIPNQENADDSKTTFQELLADWGVTKDDYEVFFKKRLEQFNKELKERVILTNLDRS
ncbi:DUF262 domain-containing protein [Hallerella succinigenes]|uniref:GmrSD restriction endonucleases N-terminal domain-containing protein n=1 Tax=Hallerella succinigenes TaxID=1896222 RepID=A0A2M9A848_9BACT|nr:DUF262 domain-containing protein [Hallerella succinigenes]PJJ41793.1 hypothetical protein BGX16_1789 [Hallerella succinigenes]